MEYLEVGRLSLDKVYYDEVSKTFFEFGNAECVDSPREEEEGTSYFITYEDRYKSPDERDYNTLEEFAESLDCKCDFVHIKEALIKRGFKTVLPVYTYEHSGKSYSTKPYNDEWDSGLVGLIYSKTASEEELEYQVERYSLWADGNTYSITILDENSEAIDYGTDITDDYTTLFYGCNVDVNNCKIREANIEIITKLS